MRRFAEHPRWLMYLPPTMSPVETSKRLDYLEHPEEAFTYFAERRVSTVLWEEKHMGSRAVLVVCRDESVATQRFGAANGELGAIVTRTGRPFFANGVECQRILKETAVALEKAGMWDELESGWLCLDAEIMPWNAKAQGLLRDQYAPVAVAGITARNAEIQQWELAAGRGLIGADVAQSHARTQQEGILAYRTAYQRYCWPIDSSMALKIAPFHLLAAENRTFLDRSHQWHMTMLTRLSDVSGQFQRTECIEVDTGNESSRQAGVDWWVTRTTAGSEGMVVKPLDFIVPNCQPAVKVRGREYLRIIYGPEYTEPENLSRLRSRGLGRKRGLAAREFALGVDALERFVRREPLRRVHECVFAILALESEPVDPRL
jgi:protein phosphatase